MDRELRKRLATFLKPLYQDLDGLSRVEEVERIGKLAAMLQGRPASESDARAFLLLTMFHRLGKWLDKVGNISRTLLAVEGITEEELRRTAASIKRLEAPVTAAERAVAAALLIDSAGVRGLTEHFARARREGNSVMDVLRGVLSDVGVPEWLPPHAEEWLHARRESRREFCKRYFEELALDDLGLDRNPLNSA